MNKAAEKQIEIDHQKILYYDTQIFTVLNSSSVIFGDYCNGFTVINIGATQAEWNHIPLAPPVAPALLGESITIGGNVGELFKGRIDISFPSGSGIVKVIVKKYLPTLSLNPEVKL